MQGNATDRQPFSAKHQLVRRIDNRINRQRRDIRLYDLDHFTSLLPVNSLTCRIIHASLFPPPTVLQFDDKHAPLVAVLPVHRLQYPLRLLIPSLSSGFTNILPACFSVKLLTGTTSCHFPMPIPRRSNTTNFGDFLELVYVIDGTRSR